MALYSSIKKLGDKYVVQVPNREIELKDDLLYLEYFANGNAIKPFMADESVWGEDLMVYAGFAEKVQENVELIKKGVVLI
jgi:hypothetical protein